MKGIMFQMVLQRLIVIYLFTYVLFLCTLSVLITSTKITKQLCYVYSGIFLSCRNSTIVKIGSINIHGLSNGT